MKEDVKKVLFVATVDSHIQQFHMPYLKYFKEQGYEVHVATGENGEFEYCDKKVIIPIKRNPIKIGNLKAIKQLKEEIEKQKYDIIHCHTPMGSVVARVSAKESRKKYNTKVLYTAHGFHFYKGAPLFNWLIYYPIEKWLARYTDCLITINEEDYQLAKKKFKAKRVELVHGVGIDKDKFDFEMTQEEKHEKRKSLGLEDDDFVITIVGELNKNKNQIMAIKAMKELTKYNNKIKLLLVGSGELEKLYRDKISKYSLENSILMLGYRSDTPQILKISDLLLSLSHREGLPVNVIEAMFCKTPIIATDCRGNRDLISNCIEIDNVKELINRICTILKEKPETYYNYEQYSQNVVRQDIEKIYKVMGR